MVELGLETIGAIGVRFLTDDDDPEQARQPTSPQEQIERVYNRGVEPTEDTCGNCKFAEEQNGKPWCGARRFEMRLKDAACGRWEPRSKGVG